MRSKYEFRTFLHVTLPLILSGAIDNGVQEITSKYGMWHLGRLNHTYKRTHTGSGMGPETTECPSCLDLSPESQLTNTSIFFPALHFLKRFHAACSARWSPSQLNRIHGSSASYSCKPSWIVWDNPGNLLVFAVQYGTLR